jgi:hypothetical protein
LLRLVGLAWDVKQPPPGLLSGKGKAEPEVVPATEPAAVGDHTESHGSVV